MCGLPAMRTLLVVAGGGIGSGARYLLGVWIAGAVGAGFPWATMTINVVGSLLIGIVATLADESGSIGPNGRVFLVAGVLGGFTTFSAFSLEALRLFEDGSTLKGLAYVAGSGALAIGAALTGVLLTRAAV